MKRTKLIPIVIEHNPAFMQMPPQCARKVIINDKLHYTSAYLFGHKVNLISISDTPDFVNETQKSGTVSISPDCIIKAIWLEIGPHNFVRFTVDRNTGILGRTIGPKQIIHDFRETTLVSDCCAYRINIDIIGGLTLETNEFELNLGINKANKITDDLNTDVIGDILQSGYDLETYRIDTGV